MSTPSATPATPATPAARQSLIMVCASMAGVIPVMTLALWFVLATDGIGEFPTDWPPLVVLAAAVGAYSICELVGFRTPPLEYSNRPAAEIQADSWRRFTTSTFTRFAICEAVFLISVALSFVAESFWVVLIGAVIALPLFFWEAWPGERNQRRFAAALESGGIPSYLTGRLQD
ncbi:MULTISPECIES: hypothetical protein [Kribbella]|uniref:Uncharacterized protein n=1 Tax=Kribbella pratensis TaxID=2512112 RepID=A0ABY2FLF0_9ACTN|nr:MULTISPECIES: hypothetical protein [Kribbella]TDW93964.1 hypothetical protein EV137_1262 [Kribbella pratensis]